MTSFDILSTLGPELDGEQLAEVDGGLIGVAVFLAGLALGYGTGYAIDHM